MQVAHPEPHPSPARYLRSVAALGFWPAVVVHWLLPIVQHASIMLG